jgi:hypothetical protein
MASNGISKQTILRELRDIGLLTVVGLLMTFAFGYTKSKGQFLIIGSFSALMWIFLWKGNALLSDVIASRINWLVSPVKGLFVQFISSIIYTIGSILILMEVYNFLFNIDFGRTNAMIYSVTTVTIIISLFMHGRSFLLEWKQTALDAEKLKRESVTARYESLKNQVNPHFLFNSFNALTNLVYENQDLAAKFIKQLSEVYRYVLDTRDRELVTKEEELKFLESYLFLQKIRFGENLQVSIQLDDVKTWFPPLVLQMLIENAIKHNIIAAEQPLTLQIYAEDNYVVVENKLQKKKIQMGESAGVGLSNIRLRYEFLTDRKVVVEELPDKFIVRLPVIDQVES